MIDQIIRKGFWAVVLVVTGTIPVNTVQPAMATRLTFVAQGTVDFVCPELSGTFSLGDIFILVYTFESATPDSNPSPMRGDYFNAITALSATVGAYNATYAGDNVLTIFDNFGADEYRIDLLDPMSGPSVGGFDLSTQGPILQLRDPTSTAFKSDALPTSPPNPADFISGGTFLALEFVDPLHPDNRPFVEADVSSIILVQDCTDADGDGMVTICHVPPGSPDNAHTISVSIRAIPPHLEHGDYCGPCGEVYYINTTDRAVPIGARIIREDY